MKRRFNIGASFFEKSLKTPLTRLFRGAKISAYILRKQNVVPGTPPVGWNPALFGVLWTSAHMFIKCQKQKNLNEGGIF